MILLESDLEEQFGLARGTKDNILKERWYQELCSARDERRKLRFEKIQENLSDATVKDGDTHRYFDALLAKTANKRFKEIYTSFKKGSMPSSIDLDIAFLVDVTGSMAPYARSVAATVNSMMLGANSITSKLKSKFPDIDFHLRVGVMGYRDIEDRYAQFSESTWNDGAHFTSNVHDAVRYVESITKDPSSGGDLAEDHLGAIELE